MPGKGLLAEEEKQGEMGERKTLSKQHARLALRRRASNHKTSSKITCTPGLEAGLQTQERNVTI